MSKVDNRLMLQTGLSLHQAGNLDKAAAIYRKLISEDPNNFYALHYLGLIEAGAGNFKQAVSLMARSLSVRPPNIQFIENYASILFQSGDYKSALQTCRERLQLDGANVSLTYVSAVSLYKLKKLEESVRQFDKLLLLQPNHIAAINERGSVLAEMKNHDAALASFEKALTLNPKYAEAHLNIGNLYGELRRYGEALSAYDKALALKPELAEAWLGRGNVLREFKRYDESFSAYDKALILDPNLAGVWVGRGNVFTELKRHDDALAAYDKALALKPDLAGAWLGRGNVFTELKRCDDAFAAYDEALSLKPDLAEAWLGRGNVLSELKRHDDALAAYDRALALKPDLAEAWLGRGSVFTELKRYDGAFAAYDKALALKPDLNYGAGARLHSKLLICDWTDFEAEVVQLLQATRERKPASVPFQILSISSSPADQLQCAKRHIQDRPVFPPMWRGEVYSHDRIRIAYLSADFHEHAVARLLGGLFERHDRSRFEVTGISFGPDHDSPMRRRIKGAFERFVDVKYESDQNIAGLVRRLEIDIAVDLMGFTLNNRFNALARRPAPIQVNYLGYLGTLGADFIDYVIADRIALPLEQQPFFTEKIVHLPDCFLATDDRQEIAPWTPSRLEAGLPADGFVFCSFNNSYKLGRPMFELWMRLLRAVPGSVLWLAEANTDMVRNLRREAQQSGVDPTRLVFAPHLPLAEHLARQRLAGLFLDTTPYNAGATGAAALWSGLPLITVAGDTFVGRMAASMVHAVGLPELAVNDLAEYEALALKLAGDPALLSRIRLKLQENLRRTPLFDTDRFRRHIEQAYVTMVDRYRRGEIARSFTVGRE